MVSQFPFGPDVVHLREAMHQLLQESIVPSGGARSPWRASAGPRPRPIPLDVYATADEAVVIAAVPGMRPEELEITYSDNTLTLAGSVPSAVDSEQGTNATWYVHELWSGPFQRTVTLPFEVDPEQVEATFEHGCVRITLPKAEWAKPHKIAIKAGNQQHAISAGTSGDPR